MHRLKWALSAYAAIAIVAYLTLPEKFYLARFGYLPMSAPVMVLMAVLVVRTIVHRNETMHGAEQEGTAGRE